VCFFFCGDDACERAKASLSSAPVSFACFLTFGRIRTRREAATNRISDFLFILYFSLLLTPETRTQPLGRVQIFFRGSALQPTLEKMKARL